MPTLEEQKAEEQRLTAEQEEAEKKAAAEAVEAAAQFEAGFSGKDLADPKPTEKETPPVEGEVKEPETEKVETPEVKEPEIKLAQVTEEQLNRMLSYGASIEEIKGHIEKQFGTAFGKMGGLERVIREIQAATPAGQAIEVSETDLAELKEEFPDLSTKLAKGLTRVLSKFKGTAAVAPETFDPNQVNPIVEQRVNEARVQIKQELAREQLADLYPTWNEIVGTKESNTEYRKWLIKQPADYQKKVSESWSPFVVADSIDKFYEAKEKEKKAAPVKPAAKDQRKERLAEAVTPRGTAGVRATKNDEDEFLEGYQNALKY